MTHSMITFVGAGPGAADLITVRGMKALGQADAVLYDALVDAELLQYCRPDAILVDVGKRCSQSQSKPQDVINEILVSHGQSYTHVVRLKGGDPSVFGRLDEEIQAVTHAGLKFAIVPGISAALAAAAAAQKPLTKRGVARSVRFMTASTGVQQPDNTWDQQLNPSETLIFYMAGRQLSDIAHKLLHKGFANETPVVIMRGVSRPDESQEYLNLAALSTHPSSISHTPCLLMVGWALESR